MLYKGKGEQGLKVLPGYIIPPGKAFMLSLAQREVAWRAAWHLARSLISDGRSYIILGYRIISIILAMFRRDIEGLVLEIIPVKRGWNDKPDTRTRMVTASR